MSAANIKQRVIKVFISSTFRDMHEERDYLNKYVFPRIHEHCSERKIEFYPIDLRWGIQEKDSKNGLVMSACLEQIDEARPFFIGILGSRYGWIPTQQEIDMMRASVGAQKPWLAEKIKEHASITEIEMEYGVLQSKRIAHACFLMRDSTIQVPEEFKEPVGSLEEAKLKELKKKIKGQSKYPVYSYDSLSRFGDIVYDSLMKMIECEFPLSSKDKEDALISKHEYVLSRRADILCNLPTVTQNCMQWIESGKQFLLVKGAPGYGTSTALSVMVNHLRQKYVSKIVYYDFEEENMKGKIVDKFLQFMNRKCNELDPEKWSMIALDNCSTLTLTDAKELIAWMSGLPSATHVVIAAATNSPVEIISSYYLEMPSITIHGLQEDTRREFIRNYLRQYGKDLSKDQIDTILKEGKSEDPSYLTFLLNDLVNFGSFDNLDSYLEKLIKSSGTYDSFTIETGVVAARKDLAKVECCDDFGKAMVLVAQMDRTGISERDICAIADIPSGRWAIIRPYVMKWCKGNKSKLVLCKPSWDQGIKLLWSTPWQAKIGVDAIEWYLANRKILTAANAAMSIWPYICHLPIDQAIGKEEHENFKRKMIDLACSPDVVLGLDQQRLTWLMKHLIFSDDISAPNGCFGRSMDDLTHEEKVEYYTRLVQVMQNLNSGTDEEFCYRQIADLARQKGLEGKAICYEALGYLAIGKAKKALEILQPLIINEKQSFSLFRAKKVYTIQERIISIMAVAISCKAAILSGDKKAALVMAREVMATTDKLLDMTSDDSDGITIARIAFEAIIDYFSFACHTESHDAAFEIYNNLSDCRQILWDLMTPEYCAKFVHCSSIVFLFCSRIKEDKKKYYEYSYNESCNTERLAWLAGKEYMQNQAAIIGDYIYFKARGNYRPSNRQSYLNSYIPPMNYTRTLRSNPLKKFDWSTVDVAVRKQILAERDFYRKLIYEMQPDYKRKEMDAELDKLKKDLML